GVINVAGRQRMLSQKLTKEVLLLSKEQDIDNRKLITQDIKRTIHLWASSHRALQIGDKPLGLPGENSEEVFKMFREITPTYQTIYSSTLNILKVEEKDPDF